LWCIEENNISPFSFYALSLFVCRAGGWRTKESLNLHLEPKRHEYQSWSQGFLRQLCFATITSINKKSNLVSILICFTTGCFSIFHNMTLTIVLTICQGPHPHTATWRIGMLRSKPHQADAIRKNTKVGDRLAHLVRRLVKGGWTPLAMQLFNSASHTRVQRPLCLGSRAAPDTLHHKSLSHSCC
jgi:hypothetical protein